MLDSLFCVFCTSALLRLHISSRARGPFKKNSSIRAMIPSSAHWWALLPGWTLQHLTSTPTLLPAGCTVSDRPSSSPVPHCCMNSKSPPLAFTERIRQSLRGQRNMSASLSFLRVNNIDLNMFPTSQQLCKGSSSSCWMQESGFLFMAWNAIIYFQGRRHLVRIPRLEGSEH